MVAVTIASREFARPSSLEHFCPHRAIILISISSKVADEFTTSVASFGCAAFNWTQLKGAIMLWRFMPLRVKIFEFSCICQYDCFWRFPLPKQFCQAILPSLTLLKEALVGFIRMREELQYNETNCICLPARLFLKVFTLVQAINRDAPRTIGMCSGWDPVKYALFMSLPCSSRVVSFQTVQLPKHLEPSGKRW